MIRSIQLRVIARDGKQWVEASVWIADIPFFCTVSDSRRVRQLQLISQEHDIEFVVYGDELKEKVQKALNREEVSF